MKISYNWLKEYIKTTASPDEIAVLLTNCGLEVESLEKFESIKGGLAGVVVGEVKTKEKHPDADRLSLTTVDIGNDTPLHIVCGAPNVAAGQKVLVATVGSTLYPSEGDPITIKKSKIRGQASEGMICAEDELGLGASHDGIMVLDPDTPVGLTAKQLLKVEEDHIFEIGLTPNRADAASHIGVARDLAAALHAAAKDLSAQALWPSVDAFKQDNNKTTITVTVEDTKACPRYSALTLGEVKVQDSPGWLQNKLKAVGLRPINNVVDITNYVMLETGQPLHAFDAHKINGNKIFVKCLPEGTPFTTLDGVSRKLSPADLMICSGGSTPLCIAGVFGGEASGVSTSTTSIFLESACFDAVSVRKTSKRHGLKTDASFRFERGTDPNITTYALKRAALLLKEVCGAEINSPVTDLYPSPVNDFIISLLYANCDRLIGKTIDRAIIKSILNDLSIRIVSENDNGLELAVPPFKVDVKREADVIEEILRIYGYNNIELPGQMKISVASSHGAFKENAIDASANFLCSNGFSEIMNNSLSRELYAEKFGLWEKEQSVRLLNPLSSDLGIMRQNLLFGGIEAISHNINRKNSDLKLFEFGKGYKKTNTGYAEKHYLGLWATGRIKQESWNAPADKVDSYYIKGIIESLFSRLGIKGYAIHTNTKYEGLNEVIEYSHQSVVLANAGYVAKDLLKHFDIAQPVVYAGVEWEALLKLAEVQKVRYREVPKFPAVRRDLALLIGEGVSYAQLKELAFSTEKKLLTSVNIFDVYQGDKLPVGKRSYALSFILQDEAATLTDNRVEGVMEKLVKAYKEKLGAEIR